MSRFRPRFAPGGDQGPATFRLTAKRASRDIIALSFTTGQENEAAKYQVVSLLPQTQKYDAPGGRPLPAPTVLLAGIAAAPLSPLLLQPGLTFALGVMRRRHPDLFDRLSSLTDPTYLINPVDVPLVFLLSLDPGHPRLVALRRSKGVKTAASISGPLSALIDLLQGRVDGDALFFSRQLVVEGDIGAVVALRNAVESVEIDLVNDLLSVLGPLSRPAGQAMRLGNSLLGRAAGNFAATGAAGRGLKNRKGRGL